MQRNRIEGDISAISNELEFCLRDTTAPEVILANINRLELDPEVNKRDVVELLISMALDIEELNGLLPVFLNELLRSTQTLGGEVYGGSSLLRDTTGLEPARYRTTSLSETLARNLLDISSQQVVIGIANEGSGRNPGEEFGMQLYNTLRQLTPIILAISSSSPFRYQDGQLVNTGTKSRRIEQYARGTSKLPPEILHSPALSSLEEYQEILQGISDEVNQRLANGDLDQNDDELYKERENGQYAPFETLDPHQIYWMVRPRTDHKNEDSVFSLEVRVADLPHRAETMQMVNAFVIGLAYYASNCGFDELRSITSKMNIGRTPAEIYQALERVGRQGTEANLNGTSIKSFIKRLTELSAQGLRYRGYDSRPLVENITRVINHGNDAEQLLETVENQNITNPADLESHLVYLLAQSLV